MTWQEAFRAIARHLPADGLLALRDALRDDSAELVQGYTVVPKPHGFLRDSRGVCAACAVGLALWKGYGLSTVASVEYHWTNTLHRVTTDEDDEQISGVFTQWYDYAGRDEMREELLPEVEAVLTQRDLAADQADAGVCPSVSAGPRPLPPVPALTFGDTEVARKYR